MFRFDAIAVKLNGVSEHKPFERAVVHPVDHPRPAVRLIAVNTPGIVGVEPKEIDVFARRVDLGLKDILALTKHRGGVDKPPVLCRRQLGDTKVDGRAFDPRETFPLPLRPDGRLDGRPHLVGAGFVIGRQHMVVGVRHDHLTGATGIHLPPADDQRNIDRRRRQVLEFFLNGCAFGSARRIAFYRLVGRIRIRKNSIIHHGIYTF